MAGIGDLLQLLSMPQGQGIGTMSGYDPQGPSAPQTPLTPSTGATQTTPVPTQPPAPDPNMILGHHVNNLLQVTGNLAPPPGASVPQDQTAANIPGGYHTPDPVQGSPDPSDPHAYRDAVNGPFKLHGVAGDILGHVMDAVLVSAGLKAEYGPRVQAAKEADAINGFQNDPTGALQRLTAVSGTAPATAFGAGVDADVAAHNTAALQPAIEAEKLATAKTQAQQAQLVQAKTVQIARQQAANIAGTVKGDPAKAKAAAIQINKLLAQYGQDPIGDTPEEMSKLAAESISPEATMKAQNLQTHQDAQDAASAARAAAAQAMVGIHQQVADNGTVRANAAAAKSARGPAGKNPTRMSVLAPLLAKVAAGQTLTAGQQEALVRLNAGTTGKPRAAAATKTIGGQTYYQDAKGAWHTQ